MCCASAALPPFPNNSTLPPARTPCSSSRRLAANGALTTPAVASKTSRCSCNSYCNKPSTSASDNSVFRFTVSMGAHPGRWSGLTIGIVRSQIMTHVVCNTLFQGRKWMLVARQAQTVHAGLREVLVFLNERRLHFDEFDRRVPPGGGEQGPGEI